MQQRETYNKSMQMFIFTIVALTFTSLSEATVEELICSSNEFTVSVYKEILKQTNDSFLVSGFSAENVLALVLSGAKGDTALELRNCLKLPNDQKQIRDSVKDLQSALRNNDGYSLQSASKIYIKENIQINNEFKANANDYFDAEVENIDFNKKIEAAKTMNQWVEQKTNNKIKKLVNSEVLTDETKAILINALYLKGQWITPFLSDLTEKKDFYKTSNEVVSVDTMQDTSDFNYFENTDLDAKFLEIPMKGKVSMMLILPNKKEGLTYLETQIDKVFSTPRYTTQLVKVALPKFSIKSRIDFKKILKNLGVKKAFNNDEADFSGIAGAEGNLVIDNALQETFIKVNESGVEAAAATFIGTVEIKSAHDPKEFIADHPFMFSIKINNAIIFAGRVLAPDY